MVEMYFMGLLFAIQISVDFFEREMFTKMKFKNLVISFELSFPFDSLN